MKRSIVREKSYGSVRIFSFDRQLAKERVAAAARALKASRDDIEEIVLFGSVAKGTAVPGSDADVAVFLRPGSALVALRAMDRVLPLLRSFAEIGVGVDLVAFTRAEAEGSPLLGRIRAEGLRVA